MIIVTMAGQTQSRRHVVIVGGGFGGVRAARQLSRHAGVRVTLISNHATFAYYPQFYHSATGGSKSEVALQLSDVLEGTGVELIRDAILEIDVAGHQLTSAGRKHYHYDTLILALGTVTNYFGIAGLEQYSFDIKTIDGAQQLKRHLHRQMLAGSEGEHTFVVVGGGPTGVELAASLGPYLHRVARQHNLPTPKFKVDLVEGAPRLLPRLPEHFASRVKRRLRSLGVTVLTGAVVEAETARSLKLAGRSITTGSVVWTAGAANHPFYRENASQFSLTKNGRVVVDAHLQAAPDVFVIGDNADTPYSGYAQTAIRDANFVSRNIARSVEGKSLQSYRPVAPANVIPVGPHWAAAQWGPIMVYGYIGFIIRRLADLIGYSDIEGPWRGLKIWWGSEDSSGNCHICAALGPSSLTAPHSTNS